MEKTKFNPEEHFIDLKGKNYLQVMWRLVWFREEHPDWDIRTEILEHVHGEYAVMRAQIIDPMTSQVVSEGHGSESMKDFRDYLEKAETKAVGRALAMLGYGTQFAPDLDEGERIVDSPVDGNAKQEPAKQEKKPAEKKDPELPPTDEKGNWHCEICKGIISPYLDGKNKKHLPKEIVQLSMKRKKKVLCYDCLCKEVAKKNAET